MTIYNVIFDSVVDYDASIDVLSFATLNGAKKQLETSKRMFLEDSIDNWEVNEDSDTLFEVSGSLYSKDHYRVEIFKSNLIE